MARVALVIVSHSDLLARGVVAVAAQMAPEVTLLDAGGTDEGGIGTSFDRVEGAVSRALAATSGEGSGVVLLSDLGSATMTIESVVDFSDEAERLRFVDAPLVEGAVAAAVRAQMGAALDEVAGAAREAGAHFAAAGSVQAGSADTVVVAAPSVEEDGGVLRRSVVVADPVGLHARPAALLARLASGFDAEVTVNGADAASVLEVMSLGVRQGEEVEVVASGPQAREALDALVHMIETAPTE